MVVDRSVGPMGQASWEDVGVTGRSSGGLGNATVTGPATGSDLDQTGELLESPRVRQSPSPAPEARHQPLKDPEKLADALGLAGTFHVVTVPVMPTYEAYFPLVATASIVTSCFDDLPTFTLKAGLSWS